MTNPKLQYVGRMQWKWEHVGEDLQYVLSCIFTVQKLAFSKQDLSINFRDLAPPPQKAFRQHENDKISERFPGPRHVYACYHIMYVICSCLNLCFFMCALNPFVSLC